MIEEEVDEYAGHGDVHPERERPARHAAMLRNAHAQTVHHGEDRQRNDDDGEKRMRAQNREVERANRAGALKSRDHAMPEEVMSHIRHEKHERRDARREHESLVNLDAATFDVDVAGQQKDAAQRVQRRVPGRKELEEGHDISGQSLVLRFVLSR